MENTVQVLIAIIIFLIVINLTIIIAVIVHLKTRMKKEEWRHRQINEETNNRVDVVISQLQPHFLFNALSSIQYFCEAGECEAASNAVAYFSNYLRGNMNAIAEEKMIPFSQELEHTRNYVCLEELRFENRIKVIWDIDESIDFMLPPLTLQPVVESAIRYGITQKIDGGAIRIRLYEEEECWEIKVTDDGVDYSDRREARFSDSYMNLKKVGERLMYKCGGTLRAENRQGGGSAVTIDIPKTDQDKYDD